VVGAAALFSTGGAAIKATSLSAWQVAGMRSLIAGVFLLVCVKEARVRPTWRALPVAVSFAATLTLFVMSNKLTTAANAIFLQSTAPLYVLLLAPWLLGEKAGKRDALFMLAVAVGLGLVLAATESPRHTAPDPGTGDLVALAAGGCWAVTVMGLRAAGRGSGATTLAPVVVGNLLAAAVCLPMGGLPTEAGIGDLVSLLYLGAIQIGVAYLFLTRGLAGVPALQASLLLLVEPALAPAWAWLAHGEVPSGLALAGGTLILGASGWQALGHRG
jgi:drug/metabolite transporter (DMT)-like permease